MKGLDVVLQRKSRNPISGMILVSDTSETTRRAQMDLVLARAEAANVPIHSFGYGRSHDPASLWLMSNHTSGTYTFVKDWYDLRDCLAGCIGGMMSIGLLNMKMHIKIVDGQRFRIRKISGGPSAILSSDGRDVDMDVGEVRYGERKEMLIELELDNSDALRAAATRNGAQRALSATEQFHQSMGLDALSISDSPDLADGMMDGMIDEVPVLEVDGSFFDPAAAKNVSRLGHPVLLTVTLLPSSNSHPSRAPANPPSDPVIVRRRMELLASDMITRALVLVSRKNYAQAQKLLGETRRILHTVLHNITQTLPPPVPGRETTARNRKELLTLAAVRAIQSVLQDMQVLSEALEDNVDLFAHDQRNFGAQQVRNAMCLLMSLFFFTDDFFFLERLWFCVTKRAGVVGAPLNDCSGRLITLSSSCLVVKIGSRASKKKITHHDPPDPFSLSDLAPPPLNYRRLPSSCPRFLSPALVRLSSLFLFVSVLTPVLSAIFLSRSQTHTRSLSSFFLLPPRDTTTRRCFQ